jgi:hypothetical protein
MGPIAAEAGGIEVDVTGGSAFKGIDQAMHSNASATASLKLTFHLDHSVGANQVTLRACKARRRQNQEQLQLEVLSRQYPTTKNATK